MKETKMKCLLLLLLVLITREILCFPHLLSTRVDEGQIEKIITAVPKIELHAHLHGSVRHTTLQELIKMQNVTNSVSKISLDQNDIGSLQKPFELFPVVHQLVNSLPIVSRILTEMIEDYYHDNTIYLEIRTTPRNLMDGTSKSQYVQSLVEQIYRENQKWKGKIMTKLILSFDRSKSLSDAHETFLLAKQFRRFQGDQIIVGLDLAGNPQGGTFENFESLLREARNDNFNITVHIAESREQSEINLDQSLEQDETSMILKFRYGFFSLIFIYYSLL